ncbi:Guanine nucleotide-binding protein G(I)/G(S)/G(O) subunit gamma-4 [Takifugu flavidus]|uniref:Guanine nucleotide-binding protein G(I)/G(S)/G(O) subunit gamma-4 n=1 Tax=Takifugu flavidus TaxID=433684 RepID=A0A5C6PJZ9_9TELE|nr:Guanine nucleotide-binding protein G(I)/G(S)/G(O) subunit gamma-4 [Takifugu flavidus]
MKDAAANNSTASISQARKAVEQLKMEACMDRIKVPPPHLTCSTSHTSHLTCSTSHSPHLTGVTGVSKAAADLMAFCDAHVREDPLIVPVPASENPFREKKFFCSIL